MLEPILVIELQPYSLQFYQKETPAHVPSCELLRNLSERLFYEHQRGTSSF